MQVNNKRIILFFAYGTLKKGGRLHGLLKGAKFLRKASVAGQFKVVNGDNFTWPELYLTEKGITEGELYLLPQANMKNITKAERATYMSLTAVRTREKNEIAYTYAHWFFPENFSAELKEGAFDV
jgi:gamma-glutamylcyclotransferase (GGCT)/AIG2-like uncharacterized protein YtfP